jgi:anti-sigma-K factor RskA
MSTCAHQRAGTVELYFYGELAPDEARRFERHVTGCGDCRRGVEELEAIRAALAARPAVSSPPGGDWSAFMSRLTARVDREPAPHEAAPAAGPRPVPLLSSARHGRVSYVGYAAMAALLALVTVSVAVATRSRKPAAVSARVEEPASRDDTAFEQLSEEHFERSKLVVLGLTTKDPERVKAADWMYERDLASSLLTDTRMYRMAAEDRGLQSLADVMRDLELVLLQTSLTDGGDPASLPQIQRLIRKRDLLGRMDIVSVVRTAGT